MKILCTPPRQTQATGWTKELRVEAQGLRCWLVLSYADSAYTSAIHLDTSNRAPVFTSRTFQYPLEALNALFETLLQIEDVDDLLPLAEALLG